MTDRARAVPAGPEPPDRPDRPERPDRAARLEPSDRPGRPTGPNEAAGPEPSDQPGRPTPPEVAPGLDPPDRPGRPMRPDEAARLEPADRPTRPTRPDEATRPQPSDRPGRPEQPGTSSRREGPDRPERPGRRWPKRLATTLLLAVLLAAVTVVALSIPPARRPPLDPTSVQPDGARALARVLQQHGVEVVGTRRFDDVRSRALAAPRGSTVLVVGPERLTRDLATELDRLDADLVLVAPGPHTLAVLGWPLSGRWSPRSGPTSPGCPEPAARAAGDLDWDGWVYRPDDTPSTGPTSWCYPAPDQADPAGRVVSFTDGGRRVWLLGSTEPLTNAAVSRDGNAALALQVLGGHDTLLWWRVDPGDPALTGGGWPSSGGGGAGSAAGQAPPWVSPLLLWLLLLGLLIMLWRGRRMGRLVPEPLPVVVRSAETAQGRAALYRESGAAERAATILRADAIRRLAARAGLPPSTPAADVVAVVAARAGPDGDDGGATVRHILAGPPPADPAELTRLADELDRLADHPDVTEPRRS